MRIIQPNPHGCGDVYCGDGNCSAGCPVTDDFETGEEWIEEDYEDEGGEA